METTVGLTADGASFFWYLLHADLEDRFGHSLSSGVASGRQPVQLPMCLSLSSVIIDTWERGRPAQVHFNVEWSGCCLDDCLGLEIELIILQV
mmetsp:Transcript_56839/g.112928  ORF Transcript_56839/g.112928 Transcript_56839/m.112928 type:complete len:93 (-) Transcript_56839:379-657(-)